jgi:uncharacterized protein (DUF2062 family)
MARKFLKGLLPDPDRVKKHKSLRLLDTWLHEPNLWHLNRHSVSLAAFIGVFIAFIPLPAQMITAAIFAIVFRANLPISVCLVWITNPLTIAPIFYLAYKVGAAILDTPTEDIHFHLTLHWLKHSLAHNWQPFLLGSFICGLFFGLLSSTLTYWAWRKYAIKRWHKRRLRRRK